MWLQVKQFTSLCASAKTRGTQGPPEGQQQHNGRKATIVFPAGESNIISGDRSCHFNIWAVGLTDCSATCRHAKINSMQQISRIQKFMLFLVSVRTVITLVSTVCLKLLSPLSNKAGKDEFAFNCTRLMYLTGGLSLSGRRSAGISNLLNNKLRCYQAQGYWPWLLTPPRRKGN